MRLEGFLVIRDLIEGNSHFILSYVGSYKHAAMISTHTYTSVSSLRFQLHYAQQNTEILVLATTKIKKN